MAKQIKCPDCKKWLYIRSIASRQRWYRCSFCGEIFKNEEVKEK